MARVLGRRDEEGASPLPSSSSGPPQPNHGKPFKQSPIKEHSTEELAVILKPPGIEVKESLKCSQSGRPKKARELIRTQDPGGSLGQLRTLRNLHKARVTL